MRGFSFLIKNRIIRYIKQLTYASSKSESIFLISNISCMLLVLAAMATATMSVIKIAVSLNFHFIKRMSFSGFQTVSQQKHQVSHMWSRLHLLVPFLGMSYNDGPIIPHKDSMILFFPLCVELWFMIKGLKISTTMLNLFCIDCLILACLCPNGGPTLAWNHIWNQAGWVTRLARSQMCYSSPTYLVVTSSLIKSHLLEVSLTSWCMYFHRCF